jgi:hypothetical protein
VALILATSLNCITRWIERQWIDAGSLNRRADLTDRTPRKGCEAQPKSAAGKAATSSIPISFIGAFDPFRPVILRVLPA